MRVANALRKWAALLSWVVLVCYAPVAEATSPAAAVCRVHNQLGGVVNVGSGTLVDKTDDGREGLVLTCWHLFREGTGQVVVEFADGRTHGARVVALDENADLAALAIANPKMEPVSVNLGSDSRFQKNVTRRLAACGFGQTGQMRCAVGENIGASQAPGQMNLLIDNPVRSGDSGGGVFDAEGRLVAVVWGERDGVTYASCGGPLRDFLDRVLGRRTQFVVNCPNGLCPRPLLPQRAGPRAPSHGSDGRAPAPGLGTSRLAPQAMLPLDPGTGEHSIVDDPRFDELAGAIAKLRTTKQDRGDYVRRDEFEHIKTENTSRHESLLERLKVLAAGGSPSVGRAAGAAAVSLLGLSGPAGWAVLAAGTVGGWLVGRRMKRKLDGAGGRRRPFRKQQ